MQLDPVSQIALLLKARDALLEGLQDKQNVSQQQVEQKPVGTTKIQAVLPEQLMTDEKESAIINQLKLLKTADAVDVQLKSEARPVNDTIEGERKLQKPAQEQEWKVYTIPIPLSPRPEFIKLRVCDEQPHNKNQKEQAAKQFQLCYDFEKLGSVLIKGRLSDAHLSLSLTTRKALQIETKNSLNDLFQQSLSNSNLSGLLSFEIMHELNSNELDWQVSYA